MKRFLLLFLSGFLFFGAHGQVEAIHNNFDIPCVTSPFFPTSWSRYNPIPSTIPEGMWRCSDTNGAAGTPGLQCTGYWSGSFHLDTSYLISPLVNLGSYSGQNVFLHFDTKTTNISNGGKLSLMASSDSFFRATPYTDLTSSVSPLFGNGDSTDWVTHEADLSGLIIAGDFFVSFRYTSPAESGSVWYIDNVHTSTSRLNVQDVDKRVRSLKVIGIPTSSSISFSYTAAASGAGHLAIFDMIGREVYREELSLHTGSSVYQLSGMNLLPGNYILKLADGNGVQTSRLLVP